MHIFVFLLRHQLILILLFLTLLCSSIEAFQQIPASSLYVAPIRSQLGTRRCIVSNHAIRKFKLPFSFSSSINVASNSIHNGDFSEQNNDTKASPPIERILYSLFGLSSALSWILISFIALTFHPDPKFANCTVRHNLLTITQALAFPLSVGWTCFRFLYHNCNNAGLQSIICRRLNLSLVVSSLWLTGSIVFPPLFAFGYDLYPRWLKLCSGCIHFTTALFAFKMWKRGGFHDDSYPVASLQHQLSRVVLGVAGSLWKIPPSKPTDNPEEGQDCIIALYSICTAGLFWFSVLPIVSPYPLATVPTILGKRLSRPASAFTFLAGVITYNIKDVMENKLETAASGIINNLRYGLAFGSALHCILILLKLIGFDGGGLLIPGRGLWEVYPAMIAVPFSMGLSLLIHILTCFAATYSIKPQTLKKAHNK